MSYGTFKSDYDKNEQTTRKTNRLRQKPKGMPTQMQNKHLNKLRQLTQSCYELSMLLQ